MARVLGVGGIFFKAKDPDELARWYERWLGVPATPPDGASFLPADMPEPAFTVWAPFKDSTAYFEPSTRDFMINLIVDDLDEALAQVQQGGATLVGTVEEFDYGRFGWFLDPEGNKVELWEPAEPEAS